MEEKWRGIHCEMLEKEGQIMRSEGKVKETIKHGAKTEFRCYNQCLRKRGAKRGEIKFLVIICPKTNKKGKYVEQKTDGEIWPGRREKYQRMQTRIQKY